MQTFNAIRQRHSKPKMRNFLFLTFMSIFTAQVTSEAAEYDAATSNSLSFNEALTRAENSPTIHAQKARLQADRSAAKSAGTLPDPKLFLGADNVPIEGSDKYSLTRDFMTMQRVGIMQEIPNSAKRQAEVDRAQASVSIDEAALHVAKLNAKRESGLAWLDCYYLEQQLTLFNALYHENDLLAQALQARFAGNSATAIDTLTPKQEAAMLDERKDEILSEIAAARAILRRWVGDAATENLSAPVPQFEIRVDHLKEQLHQHPDIIVFEPMQRMLTAELDEAKATRRPDWGMQASYQKRGAKYEDMASLEISMNLPLFNDSRKQPQVQAKKIELARLQAERDAMLGEHNAELSRDIAEYARWQKALDRMHQVLLPLTQQKVELQLSQYRSAKATLLDVITARRESVDLRLKAIDTEREFKKSAARLTLPYDTNAGE